MHINRLKRKLTKKTEKNRYKNFYCVKSSQRLRNRVKSKKLSPKNQKN